ncbi:MAG TPA: hypothetical protein VFP65_09395 [Anaeromyxobacteraceae bacterium]|nr:hypothetical protein [Anaeromyxobacteraceae bacterium]
MFSSNLILGMFALLSVATAGPAQGRDLLGETIGPVDLPTLAGGKEPLVTTRTPVNVILFWRPGQEYSLDTLKQMAACEKVFSKNAVHMVAVVSGDYPRAEIQAAVDQAQIHVPVLLDMGDALYGKLEVRQHPLVVVADQAGKVALSQPYVRLRYCDIVHAHVRFLLKEIDLAQLQRALNPERASMPSDDTTKVARRFVNMGKMQAESGQCDEAIASFKKALEVDPASKDAQAGIAACSSKAIAKK